MVRVLHVLGGVNLGGAESRIMDLYRHMDHNQVQFDFLVHMDDKKYAKALADGKEPEEYREPQHYDEEIKKLGGHVYALPKYKVYNAAAYKKAALRFFSSHNEYSVVQGHMTSTAALYLPIAKACGLGCVIAHTRNAGVDSGIKGYIVKSLRKSLPKKADYLFACSHLAGDETFGGAPYTYIPNTIDTSRFLFNEEDRKAIRAKHNIPEDAILIGNVARFSPQKNQKYLINAFAEIKDENTYLIFCGDGEHKTECETLAQSLDKKDRIIFAGNQSEVEKYYSAMDIFAFPSIYEGLPGVVVEAQASGLNCLISDKITTEVLLTDKTDAVSIDGPATDWSVELNKRISVIRNSKDYMESRLEAALQVRAAGFDVNDQAEKMMKFYLNPCDENLPNKSSLSCKKILMVGPDREVHGGISAVVNNYYEAGIDREVDLTYIGSMKEGSKLKKLFVAATAYLNFLTKLKEADIVHIHAASDSSFLRKSYFVKAAFRRHKKIVLHQHGGDFTNWYMSRSESGKKKVREILDMADLMLVLAPVWVEYFGELTDKNKIHAFSNKIAIPQYDETTEGEVIPIAKEKNSILFLGRLCETKGIRELAQCMPGLIKTFPDVKLFLAGIWEDENLKHLFDTYSDNVKYLGWVSGEGKQALLDVSEVLVLPTYFEGQSVSIVEAMASYACVVASDIGGIPMMINNNENGILVPVKDAKALEEALIKVLEDDNLRYKLVKNARALAQADYNINDSIRDLVNYYSEM